MCDERHPRRIKLGFTKRKTIDRRQELARGLEMRLMIVQTIQMPHAFCLEARCLMQMAGLAHRDHAKSSEWMVLEDGITLDDVAQTMTREARRLRWEARLKFAWPRHGRISVYDSGWRSTGARQQSRQEL